MILPNRTPMESQRGQSTIEKTLLLLGIAAALLAFFHVLRTSLSARFKSGADAFGHGLLYDHDPRASYPAQHQ